MKRWLLDRIESMLPAGVSPVTKRLEVGSPAEVIVTIAEKQHDDMIVIGARGLGSVKEQLLGRLSHRDQSPT